MADNDTPRRPNDDVSAGEKRKRWYTLEELCERLGFDVEEIRRRAREATEE